MPLDDKEQRILAEIERQFYEEDPELARAVQRVQRPLRVGAKLAALGVIAGLAIVVAYISVTWVAAVGFLVVVLSATALVNALRFRGWGEGEAELSEEVDEYDD
jgi:uncharacterized membrane protein